MPFNPYYFSTELEKMIKISRLADYAVVILETLARSDGSVMTASGLAMQSFLPEPTVAKILKMLAKADILISARGAHGGYRLAAAASEITVATIIAAVDGPIALTACVDGKADSCGFEGSCRVKGRWNMVNISIRDALEGVTLADMLSHGCLPRESGDLKAPQKMPAFAGKATIVAQA